MVTSVIQLKMSSIMKSSLQSVPNEHSDSLYCQLNNQLFAAETEENILNKRNKGDVLNNY